MIQPNASQMTQMTNFDAQPNDIFRRPTKIHISKLDLITSFESWPNEIFRRPTKCQISKPDKRHILKPNNNWPILIPDQMTYFDDRPIESMIALVTLFKRKMSQSFYCPIIFRIENCSLLPQCGIVWQSPIVLIRQNYTECIWPIFHINPSTNFIFWWILLPGHTRKMTSLMIPSYHCHHCHTSPS